MVLLWERCTHCCWLYEWCHCPTEGSYLTHQQPAGHSMSSQLSGRLQVTYLVCKLVEQVLKRLLFPFCSWQLHLLWAQFSSLVIVCRKYYFT